eukprot:TRINITY_DN70018_c0_g1_i1.p1 TRINITY_DN70018_c0_g1~~TRINITY_DN70018_c0_g1_i1.p1  ORF type:complete len:803 (+),score=264.73 TRINITY_DN70018_c0_g1_i1:87-2411(+)
MPRHTVSVGAALPPPPRPEEVSLPSKGWRDDYRRYFGGQRSHALLDLPRGALLTEPGPPEKVLSAMGAPTLCDWRGRPRAPCSAAVTAARAIRGAASTPPPGTGEGALARSAIGAVDLPSLFTDPLRRPQLLKQLEVWLDAQLGAAGLRAAAEAQEAEEAAAKPLQQADLCRIDALRRILREAAVVFPSFAGIIRTLTAEYDRVLQRLRCALEVSTRDAVQTVCEEQEREIRHLRELGEQQREVEQRLLAANRELQDANAEHHARELEQRRQTAELQEQLQRLGDRLAAEQTVAEHAALEQARKGTTAGFQLGHPPPQDAGGQASGDWQLQLLAQQPEDPADGYVVCADMVISNRATEARLRDALRYLDAKLRTMDAERRRLLGDVAAWRQEVAVLAAERQRRRLQEDELRRLGLLVRECVAVRARAASEELPQPLAFDALGAGPDVPRHLRTTGTRVRNVRRFTEQQALAVLQEIWGARKKDAARRLSFADFYSDYLMKREPDNTARVQLAYALDYVWRSVRGRRVEADATLKILEGSAPEELYDRMEERVETLRLIAHRLSTEELGGAGRQGPGTLPVARVFKALEEAFPHSSTLHVVTGAVADAPEAMRHQLAKLHLALYHDYPAAEGDPGQVEVPFADLIAPRGGMLTRFTELVKRQVWQEHDAAWFALSAALTQQVAREESKTMTVRELREAMIGADGTVQRGELLRRIRLCCGTEAVAEKGGFVDGHVTDVQRFCDTLRRRCCIEMRGPGSARRPAAADVVPSAPWGK